MVLANVPSFRFSFRGNMRTYPRSGFSFRRNIRTYPRSGFRSGGTSAKTTLLETTLSSGMARVRLADLNGPKWTSSGQNEPKWTILVHFGLANAKIQFGIRSFWPKWSFGPFWTILVQFAFRQYRGHSLFWVRPKCGWILDVHDFTKRSLKRIVCGHSGFGRTSV